jgi:hypothetical protein
MEVVDTLALHLASLSPARNFGASCTIPHLTGGAQRALRQNAGRCS